MGTRISVLCSLAVALLFGTTGCAPDPTQRAWPAYMQQVELILGDYEVAMNEVANINIGLNPVGEGAKATIAPPSAAAALESKVIPLLEQASQRAASISIPSSQPLTQLHAPLAEGLGGKTAAYKAMAVAFKKNDAAEFEKAVEELTAASNRLQTFQNAYRATRLAGGPKGN